MKKEILQRVSETIENNENFVFASDKIRITAIPFSSDKKYVQETLYLIYKILYNASKVTGMSIQTMVNMLLDLDIIMQNEEKKLELN